MANFQWCSVSGKTASVAHSQLFQISELRYKIGKRFFHTPPQAYSKGLSGDQVYLSSLEFTAIFNNIPNFLFTNSVERRCAVTPTKCMKARQGLTKAGTYRHAERMHWDVPCFITSASVEPQFVPTKQRELRTA